MSLDPNTLCPGCFSPTHPSPVCSQCGVSVKARRPAGTMPLWTRLDGERYLIGHVLGQGGFGITYASWDQTLMQRVAVKELFPRTSVARTSDGLTVEPGTDAEVVAFEEAKGKFLEEARLLARPSLKQHPGIITVENFFEACGTAYLVMEYLEGQTLEEYVDSQKGRLPYEVTAAMMDAVLDALEAVHSERLPDGSVMVHRDIKPQNLYLTHAGVVKLLDFGAARFAGGQSDRSATAMGTEGYAALEQYQRKTQGPWTDIYATAATWYRVLSGRTPMAAVERLGEVPDPLKPPSAHGADVPEDVEAIWLKALAVLPQDRWASVEELQSALQQADQTEVVDTTTPETVEENKVAIEDTGLETDSPDSPGDNVQDSDQTSTGPGRKKRSTVKMALWGGGMVVALGLAFALYLYIWQSMYDHMHQLSVRAMAVSPDGREVATVSFNELKLWDISGEYIRTIKDASDYYQHVAYMPDGAHLITGGSTGGTLSPAGKIKIWDRAGTLQKTLSEEVSQYNAFRRTLVSALAASPDGLTVLTAHQDTTLKLWDVNAALPIATYRPKAVMTSIAFSPDGRFAVSGSREGQVQLWRTETQPATQSISRARVLKRTSSVGSGINTTVFDDLTDVDKSAANAIKPATQSLRLNPAVAAALGLTPSIKIGVNPEPTWPVRNFDHSSVTAVAFAPDGRLVASGGADGSVIVWDANTGSQVMAIQTSGSPVTTVAFSRTDGDRIAAGDESGRIKAWWVESGEEFWTVQNEYGIVSLSYLETESLIYSDGQKVVVFDPYSDEETSSFPVVTPEPF